MIAAVTDSTIQRLSREKSTILRSIALLLLRHRASEELGLHDTGAVGHHFLASLKSFDALDFVVHSGAGFDWPRLELRIGTAHENDGVAVQILHRDLRHK